MKKPSIPKNENKRIENLLLYDILDTVQDEAFDDLTELAASICEAPIALISLIDEKRQWFKSRVGLSAEWTSRDISFCGHAINQPDLFIVQDATKDERFSDNPLVIEDPAIKFYAGAPIISPDGYALGTLCVIDQKSRKMKIEHQKALRILSRHVMTQMELRRKTAELKILQTERDNAVYKLEQEHKQVESLVNDRTKELRKAEEKSRNLLDQTEQSRRVLLSILEDQKLSEQKLRESERTLSTLMGNLPGMAYRCHNNKNWTMDFISDGCAKLTGYSANELIDNKNRAYGDLIHKDDRTKVWNQIQKAVKQDKPFQLIYRIISKKGHEKWVWEKGCAIPSENNKTKYLEGFISDITDRISTEKELKQSEEQFRLLTENSIDMIYRMSLPDGKYEYVSPASKNLFGYKPEKFYVSPILIQKIIHPDWHEYFKIEWEKLLKGKMPPTYEYQIIHKSGDIRWMYQRNVLIKDEKDKPIAIEGIVTDITKRKQTEENLRVSEEMWRSLTENSPDHIMLLDLDYNIRLINYTLPDLISEKVIGKSVLEFVPPDHQRVALECFESVKQNGKSDQYVTKYVGDDGNEQYFDVRISPVKDQNRNVVNLISASNEITERKKVEEGLKKSETHYRALFENSPIALWEEDFSEIKKIIDALKKRKIKNFRKYFDNHPEIVNQCIQSVKIIDINIHVLELHEATSKSELLGGLPKIFTEESVKVFKEELIAIAENRTECEFEAKVQTLKGNEKYIHLKWTVVPGYEESLERIYISTADITERKKSQQLLEKNQEQLELIYNSATDSMALINIEGKNIFKIVSFNDVYWRMLQLFNVNISKEELNGLEIQKLGQLFGWPKIALDNLINNYNQVITTKKVLSKAEIFPTPKGERHIESIYAPIIDDNKNCSHILFSSRDITERKQAEIEIENQLNLKKLILDTTLDGYILADRNGNILDVNPAYCKLIGFSNAELVNMNIRDLEVKIPPEEVDRRIQQIINKGNDQFETIHKNKYGKILDLEANVSIMTNEEQPIVAAFVRDITERKKAEEALKESELRFRTLFEYAAVPIWLEDFSEIKNEIDSLKSKEIKDFRFYFDQNPDQVGILASKVKVLDVNQKSVEFYKAKDKASLVKDLPSYFTEDSLIVFKEELIALANGEISFESEIPIRTKTGDIIYLIVSLSVPEASTDTLDRVLVSFLDITERKRSEDLLKNSREQLRSLAGHLQSVREEERTAIAREIHDELAQMLTALKMDLVLMKREISNDSVNTEYKQLQSEITAMTKLIDSTIQNTRKIISSLRPEVLDNLGIIDAIKWQYKEFQKNTGIKCNYKSNIKDIDLPKEFTTAIFRIFQESLTNISRHAKASQVNMQFSKLKDTLKLSISDNGIGIKDNKIENQETFGLLGMRERAILLGGEVTITGKAKKGTTVTLNLPLH